MDTFWSFVFDSLWNWGGLLMGALGLAQLVEWFSGKNIPLLPWKVKLVVALVVLEWAQFSAYKYQHDQVVRLQNAPTAAEQAPAPLPLGGSLQTLNNEIGKDDWAALRAYDATAEITVRTYTEQYAMRPELKTAVRLKLVPNGTIVETQDIANKDGIGRFMLPRSEGRKQYQIEIRLYPNTQASVVGQIVFNRR